MLHGAALARSTSSVGGCYSSAVRLARTRAAIWILAIQSLACEGAPWRPDGPPTDAEARYAATHNSYSIARSLGRQLDAGVRGLELDLHFDAEVGAFKVGHFREGSSVELGDGNPSTIEAGEWLRSIARWSDENRGHGPILLTLDLKDPVPSSILETFVVAQLGEKLYTYAEHKCSAVPLRYQRGRIVVIVSGDFETRSAYFRPFRVAFDVAMGAPGDVLVSAGDWLQRGNLRDDGSMAWGAGARWKSDGGRRDYDKTFVALHANGAFALAWNGVGVRYRVGHLTGNSATSSARATKRSLFLRGTW